jgi:hypothetical protein
MVGLRTSRKISFAMLFVAALANVDSKASYALADGAATNMNSVTEFPIALTAMHYEIGVGLTSRILTISPGGKYPVKDLGDAAANATYRVQWAADHKRLIMFEVDNQPVRAAEYDPASHSFKEPLPLATPGSEAGGEVSYKWTDGRELYAGNGPKGITIFNAAKHARLTLDLAVLHGKDVQSISWSPDRQWMAIAVEGKDVALNSGDTFDYLYVLRTNGTDCKYLGHYGVPRWTQDGLLCLHGAKMYGGNQLVRFTRKADSWKQFVIYSSRFYDIRAYAPSPDGQLAAILGFHKRASQNWTCLFAIDMHGNFVRVLSTMKEVAHVRDAEALTW